MPVCYITFLSSSTSKVKVLVNLCFNQNSKSFQDFTHKKSFYINAQCKLPLKCWNGNLYKLNPKLPAKDSADTPATAPMPTWTSLTPGQSLRQVPIFPVTKNLYN